MMKRRRFLQEAAIGTAALASGLREVLAQGGNRSGPNVVFIMADDLGYGDLSCYGRPDVHTPNIDRLAANGVRFLQAYANSAVCSSTRTALMTGRYQYRVRVGLEEPLGGPDDIGLPPQHPTLPSLLKKAGYDTILVGKWHLGALPTFGPLKSGYDRFYGIPSGATDYYVRLTGAQGLWDGDELVREAGYLTDLLGDRAVQEIGSRSGVPSPFFMSLHLTAPHWPWEAPGLDVTEAAAIRAAGTNNTGTQKTYKAMVERMDFQVGRVLDAISAAGITDNTIVIFTSDNGGERFSYTWPFTGRKTELLEGGLRIPAIISWPARIPRARTTEQMAMTMDWLPTLLSAAGLAPDSSFPPDGIDLMPYLAGSASPVSRTLFWRYTTNAQRAVRDGDFKYLKILDNTFLFNVVEDPMERANLKARRADIYERLVAKWEQWNTGMLPESPDSNTANFTGADLADHIGTPRWGGPARGRGAGSGGRRGGGASLTPNASPVPR